ncbi:MAG: aminotransferase class V-fold PLP-dependent enzyme [Flavobacteriales bacterium]|nr:aminotransferase class V-fold PLP-dependent enzyme [Flavobacteriales bacterium]
MSVRKTDYLAIRANYHLPGNIYANTSSNGVMSDQTVHIGLNVDRSFQDDPDGSRNYWVRSGQQHVKQTLARYLNTSVSNLALVPNASIGLNLLIHSLDGNLPVLVLENEYPSLTAPFDINMKSVIRLSFDVERSGTKEIIDLIDRYKPGIVAISWVQWLSGFRVELDELCTYCRNENIITCIDVTQALGAFHLNLSKTPADIVIGSGYKWVLAGFGNAFVYVADHLLENFHFKVAGFNSYDFNGDQYSFEESIRCLEPGHLDHVSFTRFSAALDQLISMDPFALSTRVLALSTLFIHELEKLGIEHLSAESEFERSGIVSADLSQQQYALLNDADIRFNRRLSYARFGWHFYNMEEEVLRVIEIIRKGL